METKNRLVPFVATHPGEVLKDELKERGILQKELARQINVQPTHLNELIKGKRSMSMDIARKFESALGISAQFWMNMQNSYDYNVKAIAERNEKERDAIEKEAIYKQFFDVNYIYKQFKTIIYSAEERLKSLTNLISLNDLTQANMEMICEMGRFKRSEKAQMDEVKMRTWQIVARKKCEGVSVPSEFIKGNATRAAKEIAALANAGNISNDKIKDILNEYGIYYGVQDKLDKAPIDAYSVMINGTPCIIVTHRYNDLNKLVFDVLHELCHIDRHIEEGKSFVSVDGDYYSKDPQEAEANKFARDMLIPQNTWNAILRVGAKDLNPFKLIEIIAREARNKGINPTIAVSRYKHDSNNYRVAKYLSPKIF